MKIQWPFVRRLDHERLQMENYTLRDALREANKELARHRSLLAGLRAGETKMFQAIETMARGRDR